ncbi:hypothetical protein [Acidovorax sp.]|uniref:hypothetical protein n=1 Tax=Acidovorax sp. TaxID=1872122 RepID=UPI0025C0AB51|nr:hypothetical protein [Acidovorax sp.]MCI5070354.1 hypothetical protein [Acidovorax sp.]
MNDFIAAVLRLALRVLVVAMGLVVFLSLLVAVLVLGAVWALRAAWARLTGRPATPWVMRVDPRTGFRTVFSSSQRWSQAAHRSGGAGAAGDGAEAGEPAASRRGGVLPGAADVTDVEAREVR